MTDQEVRTLAYSKSPKTTKRTTFQDELQAAVFARTSKTKAELFSNFKDMNEVEDEMLNKLHDSRKKKIDAFKASKNKTKLNNFDLSDDEDKHSRPKKVSFLKSQKNGSDSQSQTSSEHHENKASESFSSESISSKHSTNPSEQNLQSTNEEATDSRMTRETSSRSYQMSDDSLTLPLPSDGSVVEAPGQEKEIVAVAETSDTPQSSTSSSFNNNISAECVAEREPPKPKPRQRTFGLNSHASEKPVEETESQDPNRPQSSSLSVLCSTDTSSHNDWTDQTNSPVLNKSSYQSTQSQLQSTFDSVSRDDGKETEENYSTSFEEFNGCSRDLSTQLSCGPDNSSHSKMTERSQSVGSKKMESKYLGNLKVLDRKISLQESQPQAAESLRAAVYQEWLKTKRETLRQNVQLKKKEKLLKEKEKMEQEAKRENAVASFKAWEEKKAENLRAKAKEMSRRIRKEQKATEDKEEKRQSAKQVFEKWKQEQDHLLREKYRQQKDAENKLLLQKQEKKEERKLESKLAFSDWCEKKKGVFHEKLKKERKEIQTKVEEEQYINEEKETMALEMYENWLKRKDLEQKRTREERRVREIIQDSPPPPWSPPNKTVPFKK